MLQAARSPLPAEESGAAAAVRHLRQVPPRPLRLLPPGEAARACGGVRPGGGD